MNSKLLKDKVAIVTDASRGLGFEISREPDERGGIDIICSSMASTQKSASRTLTEGKKTAMEISMKRCGHPREVATIVASIPSEDFVFAIRNRIVTDGGTVVL
jgi:NAD(P)-dependent dehydrogenase (short-subunit alcohol dehydrogenase family)